MCQTISRKMVLKNDFFQPTRCKSKDYFKVGKSIKKSWPRVQKHKKQLGDFFYQNRKIFVEIARTAMNSGWQ
jgi:hypothetical protein